MNNNIQILDCTLRDGGYVNDFHFGRYAIGKIISQLTESGIDVVECGFLEDGEYNADESLFQTVEQISQFIPANRKHSLYVAMACYGEYDIAQLTPFDGSSIDGIRVSFHHNEIAEGIRFCHQVKEKGYKIFIQPVGTTSYTKDQLLFLIQQVNELNPYALYFVDTLGLMHKEDVLRFYNFIDQHLSPTIRLGFHSHNNLQLSFSNCQALIHHVSGRTLLLDASVYGMGRAAGNLNTELITNYLNEHVSRRYEIEPILEIVDEFILRIRENFSWGYSVPYYLAAINGCHPNYATYLSGKQTLTVRNISAILRMIEPDKRSLFDKNLAENKYLEFQSRKIDDREAVKQLEQVIADRNVILLAPGPTTSICHNEICRTIAANDCISISVGFVPDDIDCDFTFLSNLKRYNTIFNEKPLQSRLIHTSNIRIEQQDKIVLDYSSLLNESDDIIDNSAMMALNLLTKLHPKKVFLAGLDGYKYGEANYAQADLRQEQDKDRFEKLNNAIRDRISELKEKLIIEFVTPSLYNDRPL